MYKIVEIKYKENSELEEQLNNLTKFGVRYIETLDFHDYGTLGNKTRTVLLEEYKK